VGVVASPFVAALVAVAMWVPFRAVGVITPLFVAALAAVAFCATRVVALL
jgi:hypothetical protein